MKKIALGLVALAALSSTALAAGNRSWDLRDAQYYTTKGYVDGQTGTIVTEQAPLAVESTSGLTAFERAQIRSEQREQGDR